MCSLWVLSFAAGGRVRQSERSSGALRRRKCLPRGAARPAARGSAWDRPAVGRGAARPWVPADPVRSTREVRGLVWLALLLGGILVGLGSLYVLQRKVLFPAPVGPAEPRVPRGAEVIWLDHASGHTEAWLLPARVSSSPSPSPSPSGEPPSEQPAARAWPLLLFAHGNAERIDDWGPAFIELSEWGLHVLLVEYPGYGRSTGTPSESALRDALLAAYDWAAADPRVDPDRIVAHGRSLGGGAVCLLAHQRAVRALVLESTFTSVRDLARERGWPASWVRDPFDNVSVLEAYPGPVLVLHGARDALIPSAHARRLAQLTSRAVLHVYPGCGHNDCPLPWDPLRSFLERVEVLPIGPGAARSPSRREE